YDVTVDFFRVDGSVGSVALSGLDYVSTTGTVHFRPGETNQFIVVPILDDPLDELNETMFVILTNAVNAVLIDMQATGTIVDDDPLPTVNLGNASVVEGDSGATAMVFDVNLSAPSGTTVIVQYATSNLTALAGIDFTFGLGTLTFPPGVTHQTITINVTGD